MSEEQSYVGLANLYVAEVLTDTAATYLADMPAALAPACEASADPKVESKTQYADNRPFDAMTAEGETVVKMKITNISAEMFSLITGCIFDLTTGRVYDNGGTPPYVALGFESKRSNGKSRFFWFLKGRFSKPAEEWQSQSDSIEFKTVELNFTAIRTIHEFDLGEINDSVKRVFGDEDTLNFSGTTWYSQVQVPSIAEPSALELSSSTPTNQQTGVSKTADLVVVFNNRLAIGAECGLVLWNEQESLIATTKMVSSDRKTVTVAHTILVGGRTHFLSYGVRDIYAQTLENLINFTTVT